MVPMGLQYVRHQGVGARYQPSVTGLGVLLEARGEEW